MTTNQFTGLLYSQDDEPVDPFALAKGLMTAQATLKPKIYWDQKLKMNDFETPDEELFRRANEQRNQQPQGQRPQGQVGQTQIDAVKEEQLVQMLKTRGHPEIEARAIARDTLIRQGLKR